MPIDLGGLDFQFRQTVDQVLQKCQHLGIVMRPYFALRNPFKQAEFWRQSRSREEIDAKISELREKEAFYLADVIESVGPQFGDHVTNAIPGLSWHQWGEAIDCYWLVDGEAEWSSAKKAALSDGRSMNGYRLYAEEGEALGLTAGGFWKSFKDWPHLQKRDEGVRSYIPSLKQIDEEMEAKWGELTIWRSPGDPITTAEDERRVIESAGNLAIRDVGAAVRRPIAVVLDRMMQLESRLDQQISESNQQ